MTYIIEVTRFMMIFATGVLLLVAFGALIWGGLKAAKVALSIVTSRGQDPLIGLQLIQLIDAFLISIILYLFAVSIYELFIGGLNLPQWMVAHNLPELKEKLGSTIVLVMAVRFLEQMIKSPPTIELLYLGVASAVVAGMLIAFSYYGQKEILRQDLPAKQLVNR